MSQTFDMIIEKDSDGFYISTVPALHGCHTQAKSLDELLVRTRELIGLCLEVEETSFGNNEFIGMQRLTVTDWYWTTSSNIKGLRNR